MEPVTLVDAENVRRSQWPNVSPDELVGLVRAWADAVGSRTILVFDGPAPPDGGGGRLKLVGAEAATADDWIARAADKLARTKRSYRLVTSDRGLRARAGRAADDVVGGGTFLRMLSAASPGTAGRRAQPGSTSGPSAPSSRADRAAPA
ncbi:MAG TPA: hypothetical protein VJT84_01930 [Gaiellaceae bacterium]|nr:hypothetical protein [Gaiellaceae bacterium]